MDINNILVYNSQMSIENSIANLDLCKYPRDKGVLVARTYEVMSVGVVELNPKKVLVAWVAEDHENFMAPSTPDRLARLLTIELLDDKVDALLYGISVVQRWFNKQSSAIKPHQLTIDDFTEVIKDARVDEPHMRKLGGGKLTKLELLESELKLAKVQNQGVIVPLKSIVGKYK